MIGPIKRSRLNNQQRALSKSTGCATTILLLVFCSPFSLQLTTEVGLLLLHKWLLTASISNMMIGLSSGNRGNYYSLKNFTTIAGTVSGEVDAR